MINLSYTHANESLDALMVCMKPRKKDYIYCVGGSLDQGLALVGGGAKVDVSDIQFSQVQIMEKNLDLIKREDYESFLNISGSDTSQNRKLFFERRVLDEIKSNLSNLKILGEEDILNSQRDLSEYNKFYLSNIFNWAGREIENPVGKFNKFLTKVSSGALIYFTSFPKMLDFVSGNFLIDYSLSDSAKRFENYWNPIVLRKN